jgi:capsular polysaccharide biosynthesis protein
LDFTIVDLDQLSVAMQLDIFYNAYLIVSPHDAGLSNLVAVKTGTKILELLPTQAEGTYDMYKNMCQVTKLHYTKLMPTSHAIYDHGANFNIDLTQLLKEVTDNPEPISG